MTQVRIPNTKILTTAEFTSLTTNKQRFYLLELVRKTNIAVQYAQMATGCDSIAYLPEKLDLYNTGGWLNVFLGATDTLRQAVEILRANPLYVRSHASEAAVIVKMYDRNELVAR